MPDTGPTRRNKVPASALNHFADCPNKPGTVDLRDLPDYMKRNDLVVVGSIVTDDGKGRLLIELKTRKA